MRARDLLEGETVDTAQPPQRPARPGAVELAAAILIVGGVLGVIGVVGGGGTAPGLEGLAILTLGLNVAQLVVGFLLRVGRIWLLAVNYVAVLAFLDLLASGASPLSLMLGAAEIVVVVTLFANRPWFDEMRAWRARAAAWRARP